MALAIVRMLNSMQATRPYLFVVLNLFIILAIVALGGNPAIDTSVPTGRNAYAEIGDARTLRIDSIIKAQAAIKLSSTSNVSQQTEAFSPDAAVSLLLVWEAKDDSDLLTPERLEFMRTIEKRVQSHPLFPEVCLRCPSSSAALSAIVPGCAKSTPEKPLCRPPLSLSSSLFPDVQSGDPDGTGVLVTDLAGELQSMTMPANRASLSVPEKMNCCMKALSAQFFFDNGFSETNQKSRLSRTLFQFGTPLAGFANSEDRPFEQRQKAGEVSVKLVKEILEDAHQQAEDLGIFLGFFGGESVISYFIEKTLTHDAMMLFAAILFVFAYMFFHTGSAFLAFAALFHLIISFPVAYAFYSPFIAHFDTMMVFLLFIVLGIGADDVFVFVDAWKQIGLSNPAIGPEQRLATTWARASKACFVTKLTTAMAFMASAASPLMPSRAFGIFATILVATVFALVITLFPAAIVIWDMHFRCCSRSRSDQATVVPASSEKHDSHTAIDEIDVAGYGVLERFFWGPFWRLIDTQHRKIVAGFALIVVLMAWQTSQLEAAKSQDPPLPESHMLFKVQKALDEQFPPSQEDNSMHLLFVFGIDYQKFDLSGFSDYDFGSDACEGGPCGSAVYDPTFDISEPQTQLAILDACEEGTKISGVETMSWSSCFVSDLNKTRSANGLSFPIPKIEFYDYFREWIADTPLPNDPYDLFVKSKLLHLDENGKVVFAMISWPLYTRVGKFYSVKEIEPLYDEVMAFEKAQNSKFQAAQGFMTTRKQDGLFITMNVQVQFINGAIQGCILSLIAAYVVLLCSTGNIIVASLAIISILGVVSSAFGLMNIMGWSISIIEAICASLVVGFSVDFIVHLGNAYVECEQDKRSQRTRYALFQMGVSVVGGANTTLGASIMLLMCYLKFFSQFGTFMCITISLALCFSLFLFSSLCRIVGAQGDAGDISTLLGLKKEAKN